MCVCGVEIYILSSMDLYLRRTGVHFLTREITFHQLCSYAVCILAEGVPRSRTQGPYRP